MIDDEMFWHNDGHILTLQINRSDLNVVSVFCPNEISGECIDERYGCIVRLFVDRYGLECNVGSCPATPEMVICWTVVGDRRHPDDTQLWFMPSDDDVFAAWLIANTAKN